MRFLGALFIALALIGCSDSNAAQQSSAPAMAVFNIDGMTCGGCEAGIKIALEKLAGVQSAEVSYKESQASVTYDPDKVSTQDMEAAVESLGYQARLAESKVKS